MRESDQLAKERLFYDESRPCSHCAQIRCFLLLLHFDMYRHAIYVCSGVQMSKATLKIGQLRPVKNVNYKAIYFQLSNDKM